MNVETTFLFLGDTMSLQCAIIFTYAHNHILGNLVSPFCKWLMHCSNVHCFTAVAIFGSIIRKVLGKRCHAFTLCKSVLKLESKSVCVPYR